MAPARTLVCVVAHPDDDAYSIAGVVALHAADPDFRFVLVHATDGEGGDIRPGFPATRETLGGIRVQEDVNAWRALGRPPDRHEWLGLPDGGLDQLPFDELTDAIDAVLVSEQPTVVATFGPDGVFGHPDHIAIGAATDAAFHRHAAETGPAFRRLLHFAVPESVFERWNQQRAAMGLWTFDPTRMYHMRGVPDDEIGMDIDCRTVSDRIVAGLREHRSQHHSFIDDPDDVDRWQRIVRRTWDVVAWPPRPDGAVLSGVFDGLA
jgi:N-acetyl-1-D-myo-inositol-2-amino-2-deoxy-alpha-D-glucopyranoside deacetylase